MYIAFDIGGTKTRVAVSHDCISFNEPEVFATEKKFENGVANIIKVIKAKTGNKKIFALGGGVAGPLNKEKTELVNSPNLRNWKHKPLVQTLSIALDAPVYLENDTAIVGLGEAVAGAGKNYPIVAYVTISTGVNGARIVDKRIDRSSFGFEIGHHIINGAAMTRSARGGTVEDIISGSAIEKKYHIKPWEVDDPKIWNEIGLWTARAMVNTAVFWSPDAIVLGGSMMKTKGISLSTVKKYYDALLNIFPEKPLLLKAELGDIGGLHGGLAYIRQKQSS